MDIVLVIQTDVVLISPLDHWSRLMEVFVSLLGVFGGQV
jgi:hypothetical protein